MRLFRLRLENSRHIDYFNSNDVTVNNHELGKFLYKFDLRIDGNKIYIDSSFYEVGTCDIMN